MLSNYDAKITIKYDTYKYFAEKVILKCDI